MKTLLTLALISGVLGLASSAASASTTLSVGGGGSSPGGTYTGVSSPSLLLSGELTFGLGQVFQAGAFYDRNDLKASTGSGTNTLSFYGAVARLGFGVLSGFFLDARVGLDSSNGSDTGLGFGAGAGYQFSLGPVLSLKPRVGYRDLPAKFGSVSFDGHTVDVGVLLSFSL